MLHWLAGQRPADKDNDGPLEPPDTPAPLFAVRAFKQAIFGTPAPQQSPKVRRSSVHDRETARFNTKPSRPLITRPRSANDANAGLRIDDLPPSPTKGILLTPGTIGERRKTVTFGDYVPGKSREQNEEDLRNGSLKRGNPFETRVCRGTDDDRKSRKESVPEAIGDETETYCNHAQNAVDLAENEPDCAVGKYWKREYDLYRDNTSRELRKLITKQQAAKSYAREKDEQYTVLRDELRDEQRKVNRLEEKNRQLEVMLDDLRAQLAIATTQTTAERLPTRRALPPAPEVQPVRSAIVDSTVRHDHAVPSSFETRPSRLHAVDDKIVSSPALDNASSRRRARRHDSFEPGTSFTISEIKQDSAYQPDLPQPSAVPAIAVKDNIYPVQAQAEPKSIISKDGEVIPPDRVAAARARLAARRQQRIAS